MLFCRARDSAGDRIGWVDPAYACYEHEPREDGDETMPSDTQREIVIECDSIREILLSKNRKYGDSALDPVRIFSRSDPDEQLRVRIDDKLSRIRSAQSDEDEDVDLDLIGYLILKRIARKRALRKPEIGTSLEASLNG